VTDHRDQHLLRETFAAHEHLAPDSADVYAKVQQIAKGYRLRRIGLQAAGGAVLTAGLVAGAIQLPQFIAGDNGGAINAAAPAASALAGTADDEKAALAAYFKAGYGYDEAMQLAKLWKKDATQPATIKIEAGRILLSGQRLPIAPLPDPKPSPVEEDPISAADQKALDVYFAAGYGWEDAVKLARLWKIKEPGDAKVAAGQRLLDRKKLPFAPAPPEPIEIDGFTAEQNRAWNAYFNAGYDGNDVARLARIWKMDPNDYDGVKLAAGKKLLAGKKLPIKP
jgi:hypothetical protein